MKFKLKEMKLRLTFLMVFIGYCFMQAGANNVRIADEVKIAGLTGDNMIVLNIPLKWDNSWRIGENWDAVYLFIKYKRKNVEEPWYHLCINDDGHNVDKGYAYTVAKTEDGKTYNYTKSSNTGLFVYKGVAGVGSSSTRVRIAVDITKGDMQPHYQATYEDFKNGDIEISVAGIEMVFVPHGGFYIGDGASYSSLLGMDETPYLLENEEAIRLKQKQGIDQGVISGTEFEINNRYPKGYNGIYCMKYEISQEQYVYFLNKLPYSQQEKRLDKTLDKLGIGEYVFEYENEYGKAWRNGIVLEKRRTVGWDVPANSNDTSAVFGLNLNQEDGFNSPSDGKTIACNFLSPADAVAYADWVGLRIMTELEYEKVCRLKNPIEKPNSFEYAWNSTTVSPPQRGDGLVTGTEGTINEIMTKDINANVGGNFIGPIRCGSFARENSTSMKATGASHWGILDLTGNLAELVCNVNAGKEMAATSGDGSLKSEVLIWVRDTVIDWIGSVHVPPYTNEVSVIRYLTTKMTDRWGGGVVINDTLFIATEIRDTSYFFNYERRSTLRLPDLAWPNLLDAYGARGGSYKEKDKYKMSVSSRNESSLFKNFTDIGEVLGRAERFPHVTFRLVRTLPMEEIKAGRIGLRNNEFKDTAVLCVLNPYKIKELDPGDESTEIVYEWEVNVGNGWEKMLGEVNKELLLTEHWNKESVAKSREYRRKSITSLGEGYSNSVVLTLAGQPSLLPIQSTLNECNKGEEITVMFGVKADSINWYYDNHFDNSEDVIGKTVYNSDQASYTPSRGEYPYHGSFDIYSNVFMNGCLLSAIGSMYISDDADATKGCPSTVIGISGESYRTALLEDCRCWMIEPLQVKTFDSKTSSDGIAMYDVMDLMVEPVSESGMPSLICPPGFFVPTELQVSGLMASIGSNKVPDIIKGDAPYGYINDIDEHILGKYYWATIFHGSGDFYQQMNIMRVNTDNYLDVVTEVDVFSDPSYGTVTANGSFYFPVRCIKEKFSSVNTKN